VVAVSFSKGFLQTYPFYRLAPGEPLWPRFVVWEVIYAVQFVSLEFFFRGYLLHALRRRFGAYAIFAAMVPYCMIHFQKPVLETLGATFAGIILGFMSLKTRSVWLGACLHVAVALTMDAAALWHMGRFD
jgi:membrane protease YdiL (CAAX protease family)